MAFSGPCIALQLHLLSLICDRVKLVGSADPAFYVTTSQTYPAELPSASVHSQPGEMLEIHLDLMTPLCGLY